MNVEKGTVIVGRFVVEGTIGRGGMGMVLKARDNRLSRTVAIKYIASGGENDSARGRLLREARAAAALSHPNVIAVHDVGETDEGDVYVVMELVRG